MFSLSLLFTISVLLIFAILLAILMFILIKSELENYLEYIYINILILQNKPIAWKIVQWGLFWVSVNLKDIYF